MPLGRAVVVIISGGIAGLIKIEKAWADEVVPVLSCTVTSNENVLAVVGVPLITPLAGFRVKPGGNVPLLTVQLL